MLQIVHIQSSDSPKHQKSGTYSYTDNISHLCENENSKSSSQTKILIKEPEQVDEKPEPAVLQPVKDLWSNLPPPAAVAEKKPMLMPWKVVGSKINTGLR